MPINATEKSSAKIIPDNESGTQVWVPPEFEQALSKQTRHHTGSTNSVVDTHDKKSPLQLLVKAFCNIFVLNGYTSKVGRIIQSLNAATVVKTPPPTTYFPQHPHTSIHVI